MRATNTGDPAYYHKVVDCQWACPAHTPVPEYIRLIAAGRYGDAYLVNWTSNVLPGILGRTCDRPCEPACRRGRVEEQPVAICRLKRVAADNKDDVRGFLLRTSILAQLNPSLCDAVCQRDDMEAVHHRAILRLERQVVATGQLAVCSLAVGSGDEQLVGPEVVVGLAAYRHAQHVEHGAVESPAGLQVAHDQLDVVDQAATVQFVRFHISSPWESDIDASGCGQQVSATARRAIVNVS